jgi:hypothetical protein
MTERTLINFAKRSLAELLAKHPSDAAKNSPFDGRVLPRPCLITFGSGWSGFTSYRSLPRHGLEVPNERIVPLLLLICSKEKV